MRQELTCAQASILVEEDHIPRIFIDTSGDYRIAYWVDTGDRQGVQKTSAYTYRRFAEEWLQECGFPIQ